VLVLVLVMIILCTLVVTPILTYAMAVTRSSRVASAKTVGVEAAKAGVRSALADPVALYKECDGAGLNNGRTLGHPALDVPITVTCYKLESNYAEDETKRPYGVAAVQANAPLPAYFTTAPQTNWYPGSGQVDANAWRTNDASLTRTMGKIWTPNLPVHALSPRAPSGYAMPAGYPACTVYFPGTYINPIVLNSATPVYFTSGVYYFESSVTISGNANVVVGGGATEGCTTDQEAAFYATNAPPTHNITGLGATFVFGMAGRLVVDNSTPGPLSLVFNQRYVSETDTSSLPSAQVNIMSVNGELLNSDLANPLTDLVRAGVLSVPYSLAPDSATTFAPATLNRYRPSTLVPPDPAIVPAPLDQPPIVAITFTANTAATIEVPGYVAVPQGRFSIDIAPGSGLGANKTVHFSGGVLARTIEVPGDPPAAITIAVAEVVVQLVLRISSVTGAGPVVHSNAIVQVNKNGGYGINLWSTQ
jgi:hypothetical protein